MLVAGSLLQVYCGCPRKHLPEPELDALDNRDVVKVEPCISVIDIIWIANKKQISGREDEKNKELIVCLQS